MTGGRERPDDVAPVPAGETHRSGPRRGARGLDVGVLGPLAVRRGGRPVDTGTLQQRCLLGLLALHANRVVGREEIIDVLWGDRLPASPVASVHTYVARLRRIVEPGRKRYAPARVIVASGEGYLLAVNDEQVDLLRFDGLLSRAGEIRENDPRRALELLDRALGCWRGPAVTDLPSRVRRQPVVAAVAQRRLTAVLGYADLALGRARYAEAAERLRPLAHQEPLHEGVHAMLMLALAGTGQQAAALQVFTDLRTRLADDLGIAPGAELQDAHLRVLRRHVPLSAAASVPAPVATDNGRTHSPTSPEPLGRGVVHAPVHVPLPAQLPLDISDFTGRGRHVARVSRALRGHAASGRPRTVAVSVIVGMGGIGKTALAVHVAHGLSDAFPDGQLYADLGGAGDTPADPAEVLGRFLRAYGISGPAIPGSTEERAALYRSSLAGRRILVVLDDAATERQVRPLLPGTPGPAVLVTSRKRLTGLEGSALFDLDVLEPAQAVELLARIAGEGRVAAEPHAAAEIARLCGWIPLAVRIAGARLASRPQCSWARLAAVLRDERRCLDELSVGDLAVRASFAASYTRLDEGARRTFRLLGLLGVRDVTVRVAAALLGVPPADARDDVEALVDAQLLTVAGVDPAGRLRYRMHDLVRIYARERARADGGPEERVVALGRALDAGLWPPGSPANGDVPGLHGAGAYGQVVR